MNIQILKVSNGLGWSNKNHKYAQIKLRGPNIENSQLKKELEYS